MSWAMDELESRAHAQLHRMRGLQEDLAKIRVSETSPDDMVTVQVDGNGALCDLGFAPGVDELGGARLGQLIVDTAMAAARTALARRGAVLEDFTESFGEMVATVPEAPRHPGAAG